MEEAQATNEGCEMYWVKMDDLLEVRGKLNEMYQKMIENGFVWLYNVIIMCLPVYLVL